MDVVGWACLLAVLAVVALATSGVLEFVLTLAALVVWVVAIGRSRAPHERAAPVLVTVAPTVVGLVIAGSFAPEEWYAFTAVLIAFPLMLVWRQVYWRWQDRRASHDLA